MTMRTLRVLLEKEFRQFTRNAFMPKMVILFPLLVMLVIPWVTTMDVRHVGVSVVDNDHSELSRRIVEKLGASDYFTLRGVTGSYEEAYATLEAGKADVILSIPESFELSLAGSSPRRIGIDVNGTNALKGGLGSQYMVQIVQQALTEVRQEQSPVVQVDLFAVQNRYNPTLNYPYFMVPALMIILLILICGFLPGLNLVSEKEFGTIEQINVTPVSRFLFTLAKLIPYWIIGFVVLTLAMLLAWWVYGLTPAGSVGAVYLAALFFILTMSGLGIIIANRSSTMQQTMFVMFFFIMIFVLMSGLLTPIESMPAWARDITYLLPPRYFVTVMRAVYLKGASVVELWPQYLALVGFAALFNAVAALTYKKQS